MNRESASIAKITPPGVADIVQRERLFSLLDKGRDTSLLWLSAPAGSGKTSLIASWLESREIPCIWYQIDSGDADLATFFYYLGQAEARMNRRKKRLPLFTPEYRPKTETFTRRFFEELCLRMSLQVPDGSEQCPVLVLDNYQELPQDASFHSMLQHGIDALSKGCTVIAISRYGFPPPFARLRANRRMALLGWNDLRFTLDESLEMLHRDGSGMELGEAAENLHHLTDGWAAGLVLMKESILQQYHGSSISDSHAQQEMFDYFASEIFGRTPADTQRFLLMTSFCPSLTAGMAERLTGMSGAASILTELSRNHYFTYWIPGNTPVYQYHPLFRDFLRARARGLFTASELSGILQSSSALLLEMNSVAEAVELLAESRDFDGIVEVILVSAQSLIEQGRNRTLLQWLSHLPQETLERDPHVLYWQGVAVHPFDLRAGEQSYSRAFHAFIHTCDTTGALLAWSGIGLSIITEWKDFSRLDQQIVWLTADMEQQVDALPQDMQARITGVILLSFSFRQPWHRNVVFYEERAEALLRHGALKFESLLTIGNFLLLHYTKTGQLVKAKVLLDIIDPPTRKRGDTAGLELVLWRLLSASYHGLTASKKECLEGVALALDCADSTGMHVYDIYMLFYGALAGFIDFERKVVDGFLERIAALQGAEGLIYPIVNNQIMGWKHILAGNSQAALEHVETALVLTRSLGAPVEIAINVIARAQLLSELGRQEEAGRSLDAVGTGNAIHCAYVQYMYWCIMAWMEFREKDRAGGMQHLQQAMQLGSQHRIMMHHFWNPRIMAALCSRALEADIEPEYVRALIKRHRLAPQASHAESRDWPWPLRIHTLGRFEIVRHGERLVFSGKKQEKPLSLLKALIVHGGREVPADWLCEALWPSAMGDAAYSSLKMALSRLRRLLGDDHLVEMREGKLSLNRSMCWVDAWAVTGSAGRIDARLRREEDGITAARDNSLAGLVDEMIRMYAGEFLSGEKTEYWEINFRSRLQYAFLGAMKAFCAGLERAQCWDTALTYYRRAHEADPLAEEIYQRLMVCHNRLGQKAEAVGIYHLCRTTLQAALGITPSSQTRKIYHSFIQDK
ncbi:BTAD domain-containing putative transcriptional regulator [Geobacter sp. SVR]|uniref:BTAD domain-containing putative transcriptional regulator n=1 Tax=Geobacter sp. SVR TaxID=2495594 RepID=UPI00143EF609|nr:BTAD domain-containing putative transcriptional regulator [Geobacter sp. SVR]BCS55032.1 hypothetical protein GSVR_33400 [Geobacter sp. SVR]GCF85213.1 hypothetical protein GSbR_18130 [Geobacter sp. SVR]